MNAATHHMTTEEHLTYINGWSKGKRAYVEAVARQTKRDYNEFFAFHGLAYNTFIIQPPEPIADLVFDCIVKELLRRFG